MKVFALLGLVVALPISAKDHEDQRQESAQSVAIGSSAVLRAEHQESAAKGGRVESIEQVEHSVRINLDTEGTTMMQGLRLEASSDHQRRQAHAIHERRMRRRKKIAEAERAKAASLEKGRQRSATVQGTPGVSWVLCSNGGCQCNTDTAAGRRTVVRLMQKDNMAVANDEIGYELGFENSWYRQNYGYVKADNKPSYTHTPEAQFKKGFVTNPVEPFNNHFEHEHKDSHPKGSIPERSVTSLQQCGGAGADMKDCWYKPEDCTFDDTGSNPHDAKAGEYCCDPDRRYCSYKCTGNEIFACPEDIEEDNVPGGLNPVVNRTKGCYLATYCEGTDPETRDDVHVSDNCP